MNYVDRLLKLASDFEQIASEVVPELDQVVSEPAKADQLDRSRKEKDKFLAKILREYDKAIENIFVSCSEGTSVYNAIHEARKKINAIYDKVYKNVYNKLNYPLDEGDLIKIQDYRDSKLRELGDEESDSDIVIRAKEIRKAFLADQKDKMDEELREDRKRRDLLDWRNK